jgi:Do/DeqQ family serine protease
MTNPVIRHIAVALTVLLTGAATAIPAVSQPSPPQSREQIRLTFAPVVKSASPAVVNIYTQRTVKARVSPLLEDPFFRRFFGDALSGIPRERAERSLGSGVIVKSDGVIVTNAHVVKDADEITVVLADRREFPAKLLTLDERVDLAVLRIDPARETLPVLQFHDSDELEVGDLVLAIGNPFGVGQTVTSGIVSATARTAVGISDFNFFIQTDAAINPGNSGGALIAMDGKLVGINTAIFSRSGGSIGIGFAIPANMVRTVIEAAASGGRLVRPWIGAGGQPVDGQIASGLGLSRPAGVLINRVDPRGPAAEAGLRVGDVVTAINGKAVDDPDSLRYRIATLPVGGTTPLSIIRQKREQALSLRLIGPPDDPPREQTVVQGRNPLSGAEIANLNPALIEEVGFPGPSDGVVVLQVAGNSAAASVGLRPGDIVKSINGVEIGQVSTALDVLRRGSRTWTVAVRRGDQVLTTTVGG